MDETKSKIIADWSISKWLFMSSFLFMIPCIYSWYNSLYAFSILLLCVAISSANYWRDAKYSYRRNIDIFFARTSFIIFFINGIYYVKDTPNLIISYFTLFMLLLNYYISGQLYEMNYENWWKYHAAFHFFVSYLQLIVLNSIIYSSDNNTHLQT
jgi:hypothetical protein